MSEGISRTSLTKFANLMQEPDPSRLKRMLWELYKEHGILVVMKDDINRQLVNQMIVDALAINLYRDGRRR